MAVVYQNSPHLSPTHHGVPSRAVPELGNIQQGTHQGRHKKYTTFSVHICENTEQTVFVNFE